MRSFRIATAGAIALSALVYSSAAVGAETVAGVYLSYSPGSSVEYLSLVDSGQDTAVGYLTAVRASGSAPTVQSRTQIFSKRIGNTLLFGSYSATRTADGFMLTSMTQDGGILQEHFIRSSVEDINASIVALQESASRTKLRSVWPLRDVRDAGLDPVSARDPAQMWKAQADVNTAQAQLSGAQDAASRLHTLATQARAAANAAIDDPGVSLAQNQSRKQAMKQADEAEQIEVDADHRVSLANVAVSSARSAVERLRSHVANGATSTLPIERLSTVGP